MDKLIPTTTICTLPSSCKHSCKQNGSLFILMSEGIWNMEKTAEHGTDMLTPSTRLLMNPSSPSCQPQIHIIRHKCTSLSCYGKMKYGTRDWTWHWRSPHTFKTTQLQATVFINQSSPSSHHGKLSAVTGQKTTIHQVTTMLVASCVLFPGHSHLLTTGTDDPFGRSGDN